MSVLHTLRFPFAFGVGVAACCVGPSPSWGGNLNAFVETDLVSDLPGVALHQDPNLVNPWGIALSATSPFWVSDNGTGVSTLYDGEGGIRSLVVTVPPPAGGADPSKPTGIIFNGGPAFEVAPGLPGRFIFATEDGTISGWNPGADATHALLQVDNSASGAVYKGLASGSGSGGPLLYAANFGAGTIDSFASDFSPTATPGGFVDPGLPSGYAPFNIQNLNDHLYVTYALKEVGGDDDVAGPGHGFVDVFDLDGNLEMRLVSDGVLNSPWGLVIAPDEFGPFAGDLLVGNFGDGLIHAFDPATGDLVDVLRREDGSVLQIPGLWALVVGNGGSGGDEDDLYFTAGIAAEEHGLFGEIAAAVPETGARAPLALGCVAVGIFSWGMRRRRATHC